MSKPQLRAREIKRSISSKRRDTTIFGKIDSKAVCAASPQLGGNDDLYLISQSEIDRPRRNRVNPRVVKIKMSKFKRKNSTHKSEIRDLKKDLEIIVPKAA